MTTLKDLRKVAKKIGMKGYSKLKKAELEEAMAMHMYNTGMIVNTAYANLPTKSRKPVKKKSRKPAAKKKSRKPVKKPVKKKSRKPAAKKKSRKPAAKKKSRKPAKKKSRKPRQSPPSGVIKQENLKPGTVRVGADGKTKYEVYEYVSRGKKIKKWKKYVPWYLKFRMNGGDQVAPLMASLPPQAISHILSYDSRGGSHPAGDLYGSDSRARGNLHRRMGGVRAFQRNVRRNQQVQVALPGYPRNSRIGVEDILDLMGPASANFTERQKQELRRLLARAYTHKDDGYEDAWLFGEGPMVNTSHNRSLAQRKAHRAALLAQSQDPRATSIGGHRLPLPLRILRKGRRHNLAPSSRYPRDAYGNVDETHDIFWPEKRSAVRKFLHRKPTLQEMEFYGW